MTTILIIFVLKKQFFRPYLQQFDSLSLLFLLCAHFFLREEKKLPSFSQRE